MVASAPGLALLSARPPTPPKESFTHLASANDTSIHPAIRNLPLVDTPDESPTSSADYFKGSSDKAQKKVGFSPWTRFHGLPVSGSRDSDSEGSIRRLPPSKECKSLKSILKACSDHTTSLPDNDMLAFDQTNFPAMLRSTIQHLTNPSRASRLDAYTTLFACLSAYDEVPETKDLSEKVVEITGYIRRDVSAKMDSDGSLDTQLVTQALKLLTVFLCMHSLATSIPDDFCTFILDRSISSIEDAGSPKILVSHFMHLLEKQKFPAKHMTTDRVNRLLSALDGVTTRVKGNRVICHRLMIYQRLLQQSKSVMAARIGSWIDNLTSGMLSSIKDIRVRAIGLGVDAGLQLGTSTSVSQACIECFNRTNSEGRKVIDVFCTRLGEMTASREDGVHAPQIWSVVILFFRSRRRQLECWEHLKAWLIVIQRCLNCSDPQVKFQANIAWSQLIFVINPDASTSISMIKMLRQPLVSHLERKASDKNSKQAKQVARSTYCTLLYYAFRPTATHAQYDQYWEIYVAQILPVSFAGSKSDVNHALEILTALLSSNGKQRLWEDNRANMSGPIKPEELPCLDPKWIRSRADSIARIFDVLFDSADWRLGEDPESSVILAWRSFMTALGIASSKEVKVSMDAMKAVSTIVNQVKRLLKRRNSRPQKREGLQPEIPAKGNNADPFLKIRILLREAVAKIGTIPFLERRLILTSQDAFEAAETPSNRSSRDSSSLHSPATHLLKLLLESLPEQQLSPNYVDTIRTVMHLTLQSTTNRRTQVVALRNIARQLSLHETSVKDSNLILWRLVATATSTAIQLPQQSDPHNGSPQAPGHEYRETVKILELGVQLRSVKIINEWQMLHNCVSDSLRKEIGDDGVMLMMTEPLADVMCRHDTVYDEALIRLATIILQNAHWPKSHSQFERAQKLLWGVGHTFNKSHSLKPFDSVSRFADTLLSNAYAQAMTLTAETMSSLLSAVASAIGSCPLEHQESVLAQTQQGLAAWIEDADGFLGSSKAPPSSGIFFHFDKLCSIVLTVIENLPNHNTRLLFSMQQVLLPGLKSRHRSIVNQSITMWNRTFGCAESLEYPEKLRNTLLRLQCTTDIQLPTFPTAEENKALSSSPVHFLESEQTSDQSHDLPIARMTYACCLKAPIRSSIKVAGPGGRSPSPNQAAKSPLFAKQRVETTPKARLRHNDSQIQFAAIESSPLAPGPADSQHLTDRQKEVKERQGHEAAMFPEIRSSPKTAARSAEYSLPKLVFKPNHDQGQNLAVDNISPMYPPDALMNDYLGSSPTPASSKKEANGARTLDDPPSSPPLSYSPLKVNREAIASRHLDLQAQPIIETQYHVPNQLPNKETQTSAEQDQDIENNVSTIDVADYGIEKLDGDFLPTGATRRPEDHITSDLDVYVDAPSVPVEESQALSKDNDTHTIYNPSQSKGLSNLASEDDQVTAQLISEMERASSQRSIRENGEKRLASRAASKRKNPFGKDENATKRTRGIPPALDLLHRVQTSVAGQAIAECVMIDVRPAQAQLPESYVLVKRERSPSLSIMERFQPTGRSPVPRKRRGRLPRKSRPSHLSQETSSISSSPLPSHATPESDVASKASNVRKSARKMGRRSEVFASSRPGSVTSGPDNTVAEPGSLTNSGKRKTSKFWYYTVEESDSDVGGDNTASTSDGDEAVVAARHQELAESDMSGHQQRVSEQEESAASDALHDGRPTCAAKQDTEARQAEAEAAADVVTTGDVPTAKGIVQGFREMLGKVKCVAVGREDEREISKILFQTMEELHEAGRRHTAM